MPDFIRQLLLRLLDSLRDRLDPDAARIHQEYAVTLSAHQKRIADLQQQLAAVTQSREAIARERDDILASIRANDEKLEQIRKEPLPDPAAGRSDADVLRFNLPGSGSDATGSGAD
ncbi:MAG TPA: hypothetical protein VNQ79_15810 [Blastocatellia bacterium]|nr:hypothetical protein [Blastocatellia bacterium]